MRCVHRGTQPFPFGLAVLLLFFLGLLLPPACDNEHDDVPFNCFPKYSVTLLPAIVLCPALAGAGEALSAHTFVKVLCETCSRVSLPCP